jgi:hypothetical protein
VLPLLAIWTAATLAVAALGVTSLLVGGRYTVQLLGGFGIAAFCCLILVRQLTMGVSVESRELVVRSLLRTRRFSLESIDAVVSDRYRSTLTTSAAPVIVFRDGRRHPIGFLGRSSPWQVGGSSLEQTVLALNHELHRDDL